MSKQISQQSYIIKIVREEVHLYNPEYGNDRVCKCGHPYYRHFDTYEQMYNCGCKYCNYPNCFEFIEKEDIEVGNKG